MDADLELLTHEQLLAEARALRAAIRTHRDSTGHELCWHHPDLWSLLPEATPPSIAVPAWPQFMRGCLAYRQSLDTQAPDAQRIDQEFDAEDSGADAAVAAPVQRQLDAYNAHDLQRFVAEYADDIRVFAPPEPAPFLSGKAAFSEHYAKNRFTLPALHAAVVKRMTAGEIVVDHERITGLQPGIVEAIAVYRVSGGLIRTVWFFY
jgi:hypothetical protein